MKTHNSHDKLRLIKSLIILNMLQKPSCFININKTVKKSSTNIKQKYRNMNNPNITKNSKVKKNTEVILSLQEITIEDDSKFIPPIQEVTFENLISTIPIIIAEKNIDIPIESTFRLKNAALDIKNMKKDIYLTNSKLLPMHRKDDIYPSMNGKLFLEGFVRNKLDFSIAKDANDSIIDLDTECVIMSIPFKCTTLINYKVSPIFSKEKSLDYIPIYTSSDCLNINNDFNEYLSEKKTQSNEYINCDIPPINCEIEQAKIYETYTLVDKKPFSRNFPLEINFHTIKESILINLSLILIQKQDVAINHRKTSK